jgi:hypothetical protein
VAIENTKLYAELGLDGSGRRRKGKAHRPVPRPLPVPGTGREFQVPKDPEEIGPSA